MPQTDEPTTEQSPDLAQRSATGYSLDSPLPWKRLLHRSVASALRLKASSPSSLADRLTRIGQELERQGDLKGAADCYVKAASALAIGDGRGPNRDNIGEPRTWLDMMKLVPVVKDADHQAEKPEPKQ